MTLSKKDRTELSELLTKSFSRFHGHLESVPDEYLSEDVVRSLVYRDLLTPIALGLDFGSTSPFTRDCGVKVEPPRKAKDVMQFR